MASLDSSLSEADRMAQGACDGAGTTGPDYVSSGGFIGTGPDSARHGSLVDGSQSYARTPIQPAWSVQYDATQNPYVVPHATPQQHQDSNTSFFYDATRQVAKKLACAEAPTYADARGRSRRRPHGGGRRGRPPPYRTRQRALHTHHPPTRPLDDDYERDEEHYTNTRAGSRTGAVPTTHPSLVP